MAENTPAGLNRIERVLITVAASTAGLVIVSIIAIFIARASGFTDFASGIWPTLTVLPLIGLPFTLVALIAFFVVRFLHQRQIANDGGN